ncbi:hypothetical protein BS47DRAFT_1366348 [Hydnum rufescens UP504]|uniref:Uncharacterized protein n=1 Tax=Hydnum rufescens UP504 TaxID=1448309 RepID=A0A9P6AM73_9AGAM|nr:hypothetical protein BS47DRAFT_1366348 [Hydnum rufescens UP504]
MYYPGTLVLATLSMTPNIGCPLVVKCPRDPSSLEQFKISLIPTVGEILGQYMSRESLRFGLVGTLGAAFPVLVSVGLYFGEDILGGYNMRMAMNQRKSLSSHDSSVGTVTGFELILFNRTIVDVTTSSAPVVLFELKAPRS